MHREVITDLKVVYYRGRYWAATAWSKIGKDSAAENPPTMQVDKSGQQETVKHLRQAGPSPHPAR